MNRVIIVKKIASEFEQVGDTQKFAFKLHKPMQLKSISLFSPQLHKIPFKTVNEISAQLNVSFNNKKAHSSYLLPLQHCDTKDLGFEETSRLIEFNDNHLIFDEISGFVVNQKKVEIEYDDLPTETIIFDVYLILNLQ